MTNEKTLIQQQDVETSILTLSHLTDRLRKELSPSERTTVASKEEAVQVLNALPRSPIPLIDLNALDRVLDEEQIKLLLTVLWEDEAVRPELEPLLTNPPHNLQRSFEELKTVAVVLGCLIAWLQTKVNIHVKRENGQTEFEIQILKPKTSDKIVEKVIKAIQKVVGRKDRSDDKE